MGLFKLLLNSGNSEGIREAMRLSYKKHRRMPMPDTPPHWAGLCGALGSRYAVHGHNAPESIVWAELGPFLMIGNENAAVEALAEYIVFKERGVEAKVDGLRAVLSAALQHRHGHDDTALMFLHLGARMGVHWLSLLDPALKEELVEEAAGKS